MDIFVGHAEGIKRSLLFATLSGIIVFMVLYNTPWLVSAPQLDPYTIDTSLSHQKELLRRWREDRNANQLEGQVRQTQKPTQIMQLPRGRFVLPPNPLEARFAFEAQQMALRHSQNPPVFRLYDLTQSTKDKFDCVTLKATPPTPICLYDSAIDVFVSRQIRDLGLWEPHIVAALQKALASDTELGLVDVGANIGQYSLLAAQMGHQVLAVEPWGPSLARLSQAAHLGNITKRITALQNTVTHHRGLVCLATTPDNMGDVHLIGVRPREVMNITHPDQKECHVSQAVLLDDLVKHVSSRQVVLKLDIQGAEHFALLYARNFIKRLHPPFIFMEWVVMRAFYVSARHASLDKALVTKAVTLMKSLHYHVFSLISGRELDIRYWHGWPEDVVWIHRSHVRREGNPYPL